MPRIDEKQALNEVIKAMVTLQERGKAVAQEIAQTKEEAKPEFTPRPLPTLSQLSVLRKEAQEG